MQELDVIKNHCAFAEVTSKDIQRFSEPLSHLFKINLFCHTRAYKDGRISALTNNSRVTEFWIKENYPAGVAAQPGIYLANHLTDIYSQEQLKELKNLFGIDHLIFIVECYSEYDDVYMLATHANNEQIMHHYINHMNIIKRHILDYKDKAASLINIASNYAITLSPAFRELSVNNLSILDNHLPNDVKVNKHFFHPQLGEIHITEKESECITWLAIGKSADEIGMIMQISRRTVETHINNLKAKFNCSKVSQLIYKLAKLNII